MKRIQLLILLLISNLAISQLSNKHWLPPLHARDGSSFVGQHIIYLSTPEPTPFQVTVTDGAGVPIAGSPFTISQGNPVSRTVGNGQPSVMFLNQSDVNIVKSDKGLIFQASKEFYVSFKVKADFHAEMLVSKGKTGIGNAFRLGSLPQNFNGGIRNFVSSFMATEDNTNVTLSNYDPNVVFTSGTGDITDNFQNFTLNKGQSVVISGYTDVSANLQGFVGALLTSDKPIAVSTGNATGGMLTQNDGQDFNLDQIVPVEKVGTEYIVVRGNGSDNSEYPLVIATQDNTQIFVNGNPTPIATLNAGNSLLVPNNNFQGTTSKNMYITSSKPIYLYQILAGSVSDATTGLNFIPPLSCFFQKSVDLIPFVDTIGGTNYSSDIFALTTTGSTVSINGVNTTALPQAVSGNLNWVTYRIPNVTGNVVVSSTGPLAVGVFGFSGSAGFSGYYSGFGSTPEDTDVIICTNSVVDLFDKINGNPETGGNWFFNGVPRVPNNGIFDANSDPIGLYTYSFTITCDGQSLTTDINVNVTTQAGPNPGVSSNLNVCNTDSSIDLATLLGSGVTPGGSWFYNGTPRTNSNLNPGSDLSGNYSYIIPSNDICDEVSAVITVTINNTPTAPVISDYPVCDNNLIDGSDTNGITVFTLTTKTTEILNGQTGVVVTYHELESDAIANSNAITSIHTANKTIYARLTNSSSGCFTVASFNLVVNPLPVSLNEVTLKQCDDDTDANTNFNLTDANSIISNDTSLVFSYHNSQSGANNDNDLVANELNHYATNGSVIWARIETNQGCFRVTKVNLVVSTTQIPASFNPGPLEECDDYVDASNLANDGFDNFDIETAFTQLIKDVFPAGQRPFLVITYYESFDDALLIVNPILNTSDYRNIDPNSQSIWARVDSRLNNDSGCKGIKELQLIVNPLPEFELGDDFTLCIDPITGIGSEIIDATPTVSGSYNYTWTPTNPNLDAFGNESPLYDITQGGTYSVVVTNTVTGCQNFDNITATFSSEPATFTASVVTPAFSSGLTTIECVATGGYGIYEYSLNLVDWQSSPIFTDLPNGTYTAYVRDLQGCDMLSVGNLFAVTYPNFFTPNGDGYHDTWNIFGLDDSFAANIYIYDRFGKLLKQISPNGEGWNGTFNGQILPSTDYWFRIEYTENNVRKEFKSHFSLIR
jgi:gliding motility-associated-like protein